MSDISKATIDSWRSLNHVGRISVLGEYVPSEFWELLDDYERVIDERNELARALRNLAALEWQCDDDDERLTRAREQTRIVLAKMEDG